MSENKPNIDEIKKAVMEELKKDYVLLPRSSTTGTTNTESLTLYDRVVKAIKDSEENQLSRVHQQLDERDKRLDTKILETIAERDVQVEQAVRKGLGADMDPAIHMSDLHGYVRKFLLEKADTDKRTPAKEGEKGPEGNLSTNPIDKMFEETRKGGLK